MRDEKSFIFVYSFRGRQKSTLFKKLNTLLSFHTLYISTCPVKYSKKAKKETAKAVSFFEDEYDRKN
jgi:hypothetical protein